MNLKVLLITILLFSFSSASYQKVSIGKIDSRYKNQLNNTQLQSIIKEIEAHFENRIGGNIFDLVKDGKPIDILYITPSKIKQNISRSVKKLKRKKRKINTIKNSFKSQQEKITAYKKTLNKQKRSINHDIGALNRYISKMNNKKITSKDKYEEVQKEIKKIKKDINSKKNKFLQKQTKQKTLINSYNQKISTYNILIKQYNRLQRKVEMMARNSKEIKGAAIGQTKTELKTFFIEGKEYKTQTTTNYMKKIEIYGFENLAQLKAILAHELAHLVGVEHIEVKNALMNPLLQKNQINNLELTPADIDAFKKVF